MASSTTFSSTYPVLSTPPHPQSDSSPTDSSPFAEADRTISELIQAMATSDKRVGHKRVRSPSSDTQDWPSVPGQAASNGPVQAKTKKNSAFTKASKLRFAKTPKRLAVAGRIRKVQQRQVETPRPANRSLVDGYDSDTRDE